MVAAFTLQPATTATSIRGHVPTDGPFLEAKEVVAGFYVIRRPTWTPPGRSPGVTPFFNRMVVSRCGRWRDEQAG
jgi:hypothetical protein